MAGMIVVRNLMDMGFSQEQAEIAVAATDCNGVQPALEWLLKNGNGDDKSNTSPSAASSQSKQQESSVVTKDLIIDEAWELLDPTPDVHVMFVSFSKEYFWDKLGGVQVKWSPRMTTCAGICSFKPKSRECIISLSQPLLSLRPRKDLVETLLHEMIHAFLFLDSGTTDREGHGEQFHYHMHRINKKSGTKITVYHSFNDEVSHYRTHWWKCDGPCQQKPPYFGVVKRAMNRAPGPHDFWYETHRRDCGGAFVKIREPDKDEKKAKSSKTKQTVLTPTPAATNTRKITDFFPGTGTATTGTASTPKKSQEETNLQPRGIGIDTIAIPPPPSHHVPASATQNGGPKATFSGYAFPGVGRKLNEEFDTGADSKKMKP